jgi:hypothetical protein
MCNFLIKFRSFSFHFFVSKSKEKFLAQEVVQIDKNNFSNSKKKCKEPEKKYFNNKGRGKDDDSLDSTNLMFVKIWKSH